MPSVLPSHHQQHRPRGLWKARANAAPRFGTTGKKRPERKEDVAFHHSSDTTDDEQEDSYPSARSKRARYSYSPSPCSEYTLSSEDEDRPADEEELFYYNFPTSESTNLLRCSPNPREKERVSKWETRRKIMDTTTTAGRGTQSDRESCDNDDWEDLKELFGKAAEQYESDDVSEALPLLRGVIHECHRFLLIYEDPSVLFTKPHATPPPPEIPTVSPTAREFGRYASTGVMTTNPISSPFSRQILPSHRLTVSSTHTSKVEPTCTCGELPTAFHAILGTALFLFGNLIAQEPSLALDGEPNSPMPYWLAALDVFETGDNLPSRTSGRHTDLPEDWRMAIVWGRTLVCIADELVTRERKAKQAAASAATSTSGTMMDEESAAGSSGSRRSATTATASSSNSTVGEELFRTSSSLSKSLFPADEPRWPPESPFAAIAMRRPPVTSRMSFAMATPHDLMMLAMDQFSRGIFRMPHARTHPHVLASAQASSSSSSTRKASTTTTTTTTTTTDAMTATTPMSMSMTMTMVATTDPNRSTLSPPPLLLSRSASTSRSALGSSIPSAADGPPTSHSSLPALPSIQQETFSRAKELFTIGSEVLLVAEKMESSSERKHWASWADSVFNQMKMEADLDQWRGPINRARGRCWLIVGSSHLDDIEDALEEGDSGILESEEANEARDGLEQAIAFFEKAKGSATAVEMDTDELRELQPLLVEALLSLGNLTTDVEKQRELYDKAKTVDGDLEMEDGEMGRGYDRPDEDEDMEEA
ncbi:hypothetical protein BDN72DRAFT_875631 [Pluteus cervinus]|uniref:Uncharacterized protein n=1 Tax=Pluteus cervinus TaxID=181527 RepID=A0ACD3B9Q1_9AGAR|nr:hypothetical protein BDN72DRAFT_875631 [Pluteus cervinus]